MTKRFQVLVNVVLDFECTGAARDGFWKRFTTILVAGPFKRRTKAHAPCCSAVGAMSILRNVCQIGSIVSLVTLYHSHCIETYTFQFTRNHQEVMVVAPIPSMFSRVKKNIITVVAKRVHCIDVIRVNFH